MSKKLRFEVFKRDNFTCQYCGRMAPDAILEVDHINPVAEGGENDILNLITSCFDCNRGKGKRKLTDNQEIQKQQEQLLELSAKKDQLELLLKWRKELQKLDKKQVDVIDSILAEKTNRILSESGREDVKKIIKEYGLNDVIDAIEISINQYYNPHSITSVANVIKKLGGICRNRRKSKDDIFTSQKAYILGILKNKFYYPYVRERNLWDKLSQFIRDEEDISYITGVAKSCEDWFEFWDVLKKNCGGD